MTGGVDGLPAAEFGAYPTEGRSVAALFATLGRGLTDRWVANVIAAWTDRIRAADEPGVGGDTQAAGRPLRPPAQTIRTLDSQSPVDLSMVELTRPLIIEQDGRIRCELPFSWLGEVWARGFASVFGHLCLDVEAATDDDWQLRVVSPGLHRARTMTIRLLSSC